MAGMLFLFGISGGEILVIMLLVLLLFGPSKIPEIARMLGRGINEVKKVQREINTEIQRYSADVEKEAQKIQSDIQELKKTIKEKDDKSTPDVGTQKVDNPEGDTNNPYEYDYDQYGLDDSYSKTYGQAGKTTNEQTIDDSRLPESSTTSISESSPEEVLKNSVPREDRGSGNDKQQDDKQDDKKQDAKKQQSPKPRKKKATKNSGDDNL